MRYFLPLIAFLSFNFISAQDFSQVITSYFEENRSLYGLSSNDVSDIHIYNQHFSKSTRVNHVYLVQRYQGIEVYNAIANFAIDNDENVRNAVHGFIPQLSQKVNTTSPALTAAQAIHEAAVQLGLGTAEGVQLIKSPETNKYVFSKGNLSREHINVKLVLQPDQRKENLRLAWDLDIYILDGNHWYSVRIDAQNGQLLSIDDWVDTCNFGDGPSTVHNHQEIVKQYSFLEQPISTVMTPNDGSQYRVYPLPVESPNHGSPALVTEPADPVASPFGWHDTDGIPGPEFTVTRGNNVRARADLAGNNTGNSSSGGANLNFDFSFSFSINPVDYVDASTTNLFYWNNIIHDVLYQYGFDEASGNFQETNYTGMGVGNDSVDADAQDGFGINNANFVTPPEGNRPRMQMYLWGQQRSPFLINNGLLAGDYTGAAASFGGALPLIPLVADLSLVIDDNSGVSIDPYDACDNIINTTDINGKIAVIRRGTCEFGYKVLAAQNLGAVAAIVVNNVPDSPIPMSGGASGNSVTIPALMISQTIGNNMISSLENGNIINGTIQSILHNIKDGTLDNVIVAHEYGHGISNRLTGGAFNTNCLNKNDQVEQMGEGWSDWLGLVLTMKESDTPEQRRGIGTFVRGQNTNGNGIRPAPYSTSFAQNSFTYGDTNSQNLSIPHGMGFVWGTMLWDLTWALIDQYGFDPDVYSGSGGNNLAIQLVIDGMKLQPCNPGFVEGRDAILLADDLANNGANKCLIWNVFANRGLGLNASQGLPNDRTDQVEDFSVPENCLLGTQGQSMNNFMIYPNPTDGAINITSRNDMGLSRVSIFDINGRKVFSEETHLTGTVNIWAGSLKPGIYLIQITGEDYSHTSKLIVR